VGISGPAIVGILGTASMGIFGLISVSIPRPASVSIHGASSFAWTFLIQDILHVTFIGHTSVLVTHYMTYTAFW